MIRSVITGTGSYLPKKILTNVDLAKTVDTTDEWIIQRTGIKQRHIADDSEPTSVMAASAARAAMQAAGITADDIDGILVATTTPDRTFPATAALVQAALGVKPCPCFDVQAVCSGFVYALGVADSLIKNGMAKRMLVIGAERFSNIIDWADRGTCVLFGDGAGAVVLEGQISEGTLADRGILSTHLYSDGNCSDILCTSGGPGTTKQVGVVTMQGKEVFRHAVTHMAEMVDEAMQKNGITPADLNWLVPHQANLRIISATAEKLNMSMENVVVTVDRHGNTSAASIPLALDTAVRDGRIKQGQMLLFEALGAGLSWGAALVRF